MPRNILTRPDLQPAAAAYARAMAASRAWDAAGAAALERFGDHGPQISGCLRDHFSPDVKDQLRALARQVSTELDAAWAARPRGVRTTTMRQLRDAIRARDGGGFYG